MSTEEIIRLVFSLLGGGLVAGLLDLWKTNRSEHKRRQIEFIEMQLQRLYGPLQFLTSCSAQLLRLAGGLHDAYQAEYVGKHWSQESNTRERVREGAKQTIDMANQYIGQVEENNTRIRQILADQYSLIEPNDAEVFARFIADHTRRKTEFGESTLHLPPEIYDHLGNVSFLRPEFIELVDRRFTEKKAELAKLLRQRTARRAALLPAVARYRDPSLLGDPNSRPGRSKSAPGSDRGAESVALPGSSHRPSAP